VIERIGPLVCAVVAVLAMASPATGEPRDERLRGVSTWAFAIGDGALDGDLAARYDGFDLVVVDAEEATARQVDALRKGHVVLGYLSVGTIERGRFWYRDARRYRLDLWEDFGEWYADTSDVGYRRLIAQRVAPRLMRKRFDGLFLDNIDMVETHPRQRAGMRSLVRALYRDAHADATMLFTQNGADFVEPLSRYFDGWNREDVSSTYDFDRRRYVRQPPTAVRDAQRELRRMAARGLLGTGTDYVRAGDADTERTAVANTCAAGALPYVADIELQRIPSSPYRCDTAMVRPLTAGVRWILR
jgi:endo-alpha-1,4-polygalactosaminidase (GH114 family)